MPISAFDAPHLTVHAPGQGKERTLFTCVVPNDPDFSPFNQHWFATTYAVSIVSLMAATANLR
jgi:hypothetical protein